MDSEIAQRGVVARRLPRVLWAECSLGFTLIELLVVIGVISVLASLLLPSITRGKEKAKATAVRLELAQLGLALDLYSTDHEGKVPPTRENCNVDLADHWCQLPVELANEGYVAKGANGGLAARLEDKFNPGHSYKYAAPGPAMLNGSGGTSHRVWVPDDFPNNQSDSGRYISSSTNAPVKWVVWSLGPRPMSDQSMSSKAPLSAATWYRRAGGAGVIARFASQDGTQFASP